MHYYFSPKTFFVCIQFTFQFGSYKLYMLIIYRYNHENYLIVRYPVFKGKRKLDQISPFKLSHGIGEWSVNAWKVPRRNLHED